MKPDRCHDTHDCPVATGDHWLATWVPRIIASRPYRAGKMALFLVWDEDDDNHANHIPAVVVAPAVRPGTLATGRLDHYSLLRTTEELLGLRQFLGNAAGAPSMRRAFGL